MTRQQSAERGRVTKKMTTRNGNGDKVHVEACKSDRGNVNFCYSLM